MHLVCRSAGNTNKLARTVPAISMFLYEGEWLQSTFLVKFPRGGGTYVETLTIQPASFRLLNDRCLACYCCFVKDQGRWPLSSILCLYSSFLGSLLFWPFSTSSCTTAARFFFFLFFLRMISWLMSSNSFLFVAVRTYLFCPYSHVAGGERLGPAECCRLYSNNHLLKSSA